MVGVEGVVLDVVLVFWMCRFECVGIVWVVVGEVVFVYCCCVWNGGWSVGVGMGVVCGGGEVGEGVGENGCCKCGW